MPFHPRHFGFPAGAFLLLTRLTERHMILRFLGLLLLTLALRAPAATPPEYEKLKADAEKLFADHSFSLAHETYQKAAALELPDNEKRWVQFRLADTLWRSQ